MAHVHEAIDLTVEVFIVYKNTVLLRKHDKYKMWLSVGGHIELTEDPNQAAIREVREEVGLDVELYSAHGHLPGDAEGYQNLIPPQFVNRHRINQTHEHVTLVYFGRSASDVITQQVPVEQSDECRWFTREEIDTYPGIRETVRAYARAALHALAG